jgi:flavin-dependent dehydrogenase
MTSVIDVVIAGAGPAGATTALCLAKRGLLVVLIDPLEEAGVHIGETLPPITSELLAYLGVWERFANAGHRPAYAIRSAWGSAEPMDQDHIFNPYGHGWHVDRGAFDAMLVEAAVDAGARLIRGTVDQASRNGDTWAIESGGHALRAGCLVDATGRAARVARRLGARRLALDRLIAVVAKLPPENTTDSAEGVTLVEAVPDGWWYSARTPDDYLLLAYMTDADMWVRSARRTDALAAELEEAPLTRARVRAAPEGPLRVVAAVSAQLRPSAGRGWLASGDAAMAVDPLSGNGICFALRSGIRVAAAIADERGGDQDAIDRYSADVSRAFSEYVDEWRWFYGSEPRFSSREFWRRRQPAQPIESR